MKKIKRRFTLICCGLLAFMLFSATVSAQEKVKMKKKKSDRQTKHVDQPTPIHYEYKKVTAEQRKLKEAQETEQPSKTKAKSVYEKRDAKKKPIKVTSQVRARYTKLTKDSGDE